MGTDQPGHRERAMRMSFATVSYAKGPAKSRIGKGTTYSRAATTPHRSRASASEGSHLRTAWASALVLIVGVGSLTLAHAQSSGSTATGTQRAPRGCVYERTTVPSTSANVTAPREFARIPAIVAPSAKSVIEVVASDDFLPAIPAAEVESVRPIWLISAPLRVTRIRLHEGEVLLCGLHGANNSD
jgi:hypothetical protein